MSEALGKGKTIMKTIILIIFMIFAVGKFLTYATDCPPCPYARKNTGLGLGQVDFEEKRRQKAEFIAKYGKTPEELVNEQKTGGSQIYKYRELVQGLMEDISVSTETIAVIGFSKSNHVTSQDCGIVTERVTTQFVNTKKAKILERKHLDKLLKEVKLQKSGLFKDRALAIGKLSGADIIVAGSISYLSGDRLEITARLIQVNSGEVLSAALAIVKKEW